MLKEFVWNTFENTGNVDFYMFYREIEEKSREIVEHNAAADEVAISNPFNEVVMV